MKHISWNDYASLTVKCKVLKRKKSPIDFSRRIVRTVQSGLSCFKYTIYYNYNATDSIRVSKNYPVSRRLSGDNTMWSFLKPAYP